MIFTGILKMADDTLLNFYESGEVLRTINGQRSRITMPEAAQFIQNSDFTYGGKTYTIDGELVTFARFSEAVKNIPIPGPHVSLEDYKEIYGDQSLPADHFLDEDDDTGIVTIKPNNDGFDDDDSEVTIVDPENAGEWWK